MNILYIYRYVYIYMYVLYYIIYLLNTVRERFKFDLMYRYSLCPFVCISSVFNLHATYSYNILVCKKMRK